MNRNELSKSRGRPYLPPFPRIRRDIPAYCVVDLFFTFDVTLRDEHYLVKLFSQQVQQANHVILSTLRIINFRTQTR